MGVIVLITGILAIGSPFIAGVSVALAVGILLIVGGVGQVIFAIPTFAVSVGTGLVSTIIGVLSVLIGGYMLSNPGIALVTLTLFLAGYFIVSGILEAVLSFQAKPASGWGWSLFSGIVSVLLGIMIWNEFPMSGAWAVGILVGIRLIFGGWTLIMFGSAARGVTKGLAQA
ncbi:MAG: HdeD family acid-resistance protein [Betaproteobacteria bacterium]|nr:MAG: HdeD family acid-resistance protein [Betaproteobacteria bacterium]